MSTNKVDFQPNLKNDLVELKPLKENDFFEQIYIPFNAYGDHHALCTLCLFVVSSSNPLTCSTTSTK